LIAEDIPEGASKIATGASDPPETRLRDFSKNYATCNLIIREDSRDARHMTAYKSGYLNIK